MSVTGDLTDFDLVSVVQSLARRRATGSLAIAGDGADVTLAFDRGRLVAATSPHLTRRILHVLRQRGLVTDAQVHDARRGGGDRDGSLADVLVGQGVVPAGTMTECVEAESVAVLARAFAARRGTFAWSSGTAEPPRPATTVAATDRTLLRAVARGDEILAHRALLPAPHVPLAPSLNLCDYIAVDAFAGGYRPGEIEHAILIALYDGARTLDDLEARVPSDEFARLRAVRTLREHGLIHAQTDIVPGPRKHPRRSAFFAGEIVIRPVSRRPRPAEAAAHAG